MRSDSVSQTKWRITTEAENSARGSAFVFCYGDCQQRNCRRICTTEPPFAQADRAYNAPHLTRRKSPVPFSKLETPQRRGFYPLSILCIILSAKITASAMIECRAGDGRRWDRPGP